MKIALIGYGKMGKAIEQIALNRGHEIVLKISSANVSEMTTVNLKKADIAIEFTRPEAARNSVISCLNAEVSVVSGSTGWNEELHYAIEIAKQNKVAFIHASNYIIGVNIFFEINRLLASLMQPHKEYKATIEEHHHIQKMDAPSGTAITIAEQIMVGIPSYTGWVSGNNTDGNVLPVISHRIGQVPGTHKVTYSSSIDDLEITHTAHTREGFAKGAVLAAEFILGKRGIFNMQDVLGIQHD